MDLWSIRLEALRLATAGVGYLDVDEIIQRANTIEQFIKHGFISPEMQKLLDEQSAQPEN